MFKDQIIEYQSFMKGMLHRKNKYNGFLNLYSNKSFETQQKALNAV